MRSKPSATRQKQQEAIAHAKAQPAAKAVLYPVYVHKEPASAYGAVFPDFPGCFAAADTLDGLPRAAQEAFEAHYGANDEPVPAPSSPELWAGSADYASGFWLLVPIDLAPSHTHGQRE